MRFRLGEIRIAFKQNPGDKRNLALLIYEEANINRENDKLVEPFAFAL